MRKLLSILLLALFLDRRPEAEWGKRQIANWIGIGGLIYFIVFSFLIIEGIADIHRDAPLWYYSMGLFLLIGYFQDWPYVMKRDNAKWWQTFHIFFVTFIVLRPVALCGKAESMPVKACGNPAGTISSLFL